MSESPSDYDQSPSSKYEKGLQYLNTAVESGEVSETERELVIDFLKAFKSDVYSIPVPKGKSAKSDNTLAAYNTRLRTVARRLKPELDEATAADINHLWDLMASGDHEDVKDDGVSQNTLNAYQVAVREFYDYYDFGPTKEEIAMVNSVKRTVDERDMFTRDEIERMREVIDHPRDRCLFELLLYTGQRIRVIQTLRIKDINVQEGTFFLNEDDGGLKGAQGKRPMLGARAAVRNWLDYHPCPNDPDAYLITHRSSYPNAEGGGMIKQASLNRILRKIGRWADVEKPCHAHSFRHNFVTICKTQYNLDDSTIKHLIGHQPDSNVMETTYAHLTDDDHIKAAEIATGMREPEDDGLLTPEVCPTCDQPQPRGAKACSHCGNVFTPDAQSVQTMVDDSLWEGKSAAEDDDEEQAVDALRDAVNNNPNEVLQLLLEASDVDIDDLSI